MSDNTFDLEILSAWTTFETHLARYISVMEDDDTLVVESHYDSMDELADAPACIQFFAWNQTSVRCEVPSNRFLHPMRMLEPEDHSTLLDMGFNAPDLCEHEPEGNGSMSFYIDVDRARPEELVTKVLRVFREMWSIAHPSFLRASTSGRESTPAFATTPSHAPSGSGDMLRILVDGAVERLLGHPPKRDDDGDIPLVRGEQVTYVRVLEDDEYVEVFSRVVHSVENLENAAVILAQLNRQWPTIKLILVEQSVLGVVRVDGAPFVAEHLLRALRSFAELAEASDELAEELGGQPIRATGDTAFNDGMASEHEDPGAEYESHECHEFPPALMALLELDADGTGELSAEEVAVICEHDRDTILDYLRISQEQETAWHEALTESIRRKDDDTDLCAGEKRAWTHAIRNLRRGLRVVVLPAKDAAPTQLGLFDDQA